MLVLRSFDTANFAGLLSCLTSFLTSCLPPGAVTRR
jgi:hypothetical protein